ncbi:hypothetical protein BG015_010705 [Linnemannia schmuckeri]|uniref:C2 domain-containing protein n=1 Tax=Linnemannia schmuckeri TaxID=64567 RepID=A0A9P5RX59_9FUNG|nr:hypothetical protein BG015_010705 [Linnemannia schmuckeri]
MLAQQHQTPTLSIIAHSASNLKDVESFGKQDPYFRFTLNLENPKSFQKTFVHKNAGKNPVWNQSFNTPLNGEQDLFIEIMDEENTADAVIAFAAIPLNQVVHAPGGNLNAIFPVYTPDGKQNGEVTLTLTAHNVPGQNSGYHDAGRQEDARFGVSRIVDVHLKRVKSLKNKEKAADAGIAVAGGLFALGAGLLANKLNNDHNKQEQAKKDAELEQQQERERFEEEKRRLEAEQAKFQADQEAYKKQQEQNQNQHQHQHESHHHHHYEEHSHKSHGSREWDPVESYSAGDKVEYRGRDYICLQGHVSNPTWEPTVAHSLWRAD